MGGSTEKRHFDVSRGTISMDGFPKLFLIRIYFEAQNSSNETKYSRVGKVNFLKAVFHKIYLVHS